MLNFKDNERYACSRACSLLPDCVVVQSAFSETALKSVNLVLVSVRCQQE